MQHTPLDPTQLSSSAQRALGPGAGRMMAARGLMPLPPADQVAVLYQLSIDGDAAVVTAAKATAAGLPDRLLAGTLADPGLDSRVLDYFAGIAHAKPGVFDAIAMNPSAADETVAMLATKGTAKEIDMIAHNEQRLLRHPEIIGAMYMNRHARMSTVDRVVELAVRNNVRVPGLACWDEVARALQGYTPAGPEGDALFDSAADAFGSDDTSLTTGDAEALPDGDEPAIEGPMQWNKMSIPAKIRLATIGTAFHRAVAIRDPNRSIAMAAIKSPGVTDIEAARHARNQTLPEDVIRVIAGNRSWTKMYGIKVSLCRNPKTPVSESTRFLPFLRERDLMALMRSKGIPSALVAQATKMSMQRKGKQEK